MKHVVTGETPDEFYTRTSGTIQDSSIVLEEASLGQATGHTTTDRSPS